MKRRETQRTASLRPRAGIGSERARSERGLTLLEILVTLAVIAVVAAIVIPNFTTFIRRAKVEGATNEIIRVLYEARAEAVSRGVPVVVHPDIRGDEHWVVAWADVDENLQFGGTIAADGTYTAAVGAYKSVDYPVLEWRLPFGGYDANGDLRRPQFNLYFWNQASTNWSTNPENAVSGLDLPQEVTDNGWEASYGDWEQAVIYQADGSVEDTGSLFVGQGDPAGNRNFLELEVGPRASGRVQLKKFVIDAPGIGNAKYLPRGTDYKWRWY